MLLNGRTVPGGSWQKCGEDVSRDEAECSNDIVWAQPPPATSWSLTPDLWCTAAWLAVQCTVYSVLYSGRGWAWLVPHPAIHRELPRPRSHQQQTSASLSLTSAW